MNDANFSTCKDSASIVPYMYGELSAADCASFESHLLDCGDCTDQFADISTARYEVYEWKKLEFEPLETPQFDVPYDFTQSSTADSWSDKIRAAFGRGWSVPGFAFAGLAVIATFVGMIVLTRDGDSGITTTANLNVPAISETVSPLPQATDPTVAKELAVDPVVPNRIRMKPAVQNEVKRANQVRKTSRRQRVETRPTSARNLSPSLNDFAEDEDTSLRLAELLDDIETSD